MSENNLAPNRAPIKASDASVALDRVEALIAAKDKILADSDEIHATIKINGLFRYVTSSHAPLYEHYARFAVRSNEETRINELLFDTPFFFYFARETNEIEKSSTDMECADIIAKGIAQYLITKIQNIEKHGSLKKVIFINLFSLLQSRKMFFSYLFRGTGRFEDFRTPKDRAAVEYMYSQFEENFFERNSDDGALSKFQVLFNSFNENEPLDAFYQLTFSLFFIDSYCVYLFASMDPEVMPGSLTEDETERFMENVMQIFNWDFDKAFNVFEKKYYTYCIDEAKKIGLNFTNPMSSTSGKMIKYISDEKALLEIQKLLDWGANKEDVASSLAGLDSDGAWQMREELLKDGVDKPFIAFGLAGLDSERAWQMRKELLDTGINKGSIATGLAGLDSERAWQMRMDLYVAGADWGSIVMGLAGLDSDGAWQKRQGLLEAGADMNKVAVSLAGLDSERAWQMREELIESGADKDWIAHGLAGLDSDRAWQMRGHLLNKGADKGWVAAGLAGLDSDRAWQMRRELIETGADKNLVAQGLAGLGSAVAWQWRKLFLETDMGKGAVAKSIVGDSITFVWRLKMNEKKEASKVEGVDKEIRIEDIPF